MSDRRISESATQAIAERDRLREALRRIADVRATTTSDTLAALNRARDIARAALAREQEGK